MKKVMKWCATLALIVAFSLALYAGGYIHCGLDACGQDCNFPDCPDASWCNGCVIHGCLNGHSGWRFDIQCYFERP